MGYFKFITCLHNLKISADLDQGDKFHDDFYITNNKRFIKEFLNIQESNLIGPLINKSIINSEIIIYKYFKFENGTPNDSFLLPCITYVKCFCNAIWLLKDNNVNCEEGYLFYQVDDTINVHTNFYSVLYTSCDLNKNVLNIDRDELRTVRNIYQNYLSSEPTDSTNKLSLLTEDFDRISRALLLLHQVRAQPDLGLKIANYITTLEAIFSTSSNEITHQLSERVAFFCANNSTERLEIYKKLKNAYSIRSLIIHGDKLSSKRVSELENISKECDVILRKSLLKILQSDELLNIFKSKAENINEYFLNCIFGIK